MRAFYLNYDIRQSLTGKLSWTHYCELLSISDKDKRSFYENESTNSNWSVREMKRQINTSLFERLLLSKGDINKQEVLKMSAKGIELARPGSILECELKENGKLRQESLRLSFLMPWKKTKSSLYKMV